MACGHASFWCDFCIPNGCALVGVFYRRRTPPPRRRRARPPKLQVPVDNDKVFEYVSKDRGSVYLDRNLAERRLCILLSEENSRGVCLTDNEFRIQKENPPHNGSEHMSNFEFRVKRCVRVLVYTTSRPRIGKVVAYISGFWTSTRPPSAEIYECPGSVLRLFVGTRTLYPSKRPPLSSP